MTPTLTARFARYVGTRDWIRLGVRRRVVNRLFPLGGTPTFHYEVPFHGSVYEGDTRIAQDWHNYFFGGYELKEVSFILRLLRHMDRPIALDVGGNLGGHAVAMTSVAEFVHTFEPFPELASAIQRRVNLNRLRNIEVHPFGLSQATEQLPYFLDANSINSGTGSFLREHANAPLVGELQLVRGDDWSAGRRVDFIKIDVEGYEGHVLRGLSSTLSQNSPIIVMEITKTSFAQIESMGGLSAILPFNYRLYELVNPAYSFGIIQLKQFGLVQCNEVSVGEASRNYVIVPESRFPLFSELSDV